MPKYFFNVADADGVAETSVMSAKVTGTTSQVSIR